MPDSTPPRPTRSAWRWGVPAVCVAAGLLLGVTHSVSPKSGTYHGQFIVGTG